MWLDARASRGLAWAAAVGFLIAHIFTLAPTLGDIDSLNFALGLRHFDPALHQPHPPGYPVFIALGHVSLAVVRLLSPGMAATSREALALAFWSTLAGALAVVVGWRLFTRLESRPAGDRPVWAALLMAASPLFWVTAQRPMSDMPGLAAALAAQALLLGGRLVPGALLAGFAPGIRSQALWLTAPLLLYVLTTRPRASRWRDAMTATAAFAVGALVWVVPLIVASGGPAAYLAALGSQAGEDFAGVDMLYSHPTLRRLALGLVHTFVDSWGPWPLAAVVLPLAVLGGVVLLVRDRPAFIRMLVAFVPYLVLHLVFQETVTTRYALPVVPLMAMAAVHGAAWLGGVRPPLATLLPAGLVVASIWVAVPAGEVYARAPHPASQALDDIARAAGAAPPAFLTAHLSLVRSVEAAALTNVPVRIVPGTDPRLQLVDYWASGGTAPVWFLADPRRADLDLIDSAARRDVTRYRWAAADVAALGGVRPAAADWYRLSPPEWFAVDGWSLTPETGGVTAAADLGPHRAPIVAYVRRGPEPRRLVVGARHRGDASDGDADMVLTLDGVVVERWRLTYAERNLLRFIDLPGVPDGPGGYARLAIEARPVAGKAFPVAIRQFDLQPASRLVWAYGPGWHEAESEFAVGSHWRWTSARARLEVRGATGAVRVTLRAESPLRYFDAAPVVTLSAGGRVLATLRPTGDFTLTATVPAGALAADGGILLETTRVFLPPGDPRPLGLRVIECRVEAVDAAVSR